MRALSLKEVKKILRHGPYGWPGAYPIYFIMGDGSAASFNGVKAEWKRICRAYLDSSDCFEADWMIQDVDINWENHDLICELSGEAIEAAY